MTFFLLHHVRKGTRLSPSLLFIIVVRGESLGTRLWDECIQNNDPNIALWFMYMVTWWGMWRRCGVWRRFGGVEEMWGHAGWMVGVWESGCWCWGWPGRRQTVELWLTILLRLCDPAQWLRIQRRAAERQRSQQDLHIQFTVYHSSNSCWHQWSSTTYYLTLTNLCHEAIHYHWTLSSSHSSIMEASACAWFACIRERLTRPLTKNFKWVIHLKSLLQNHRSPCIPQHW